VIAVEDDRMPKKGAIPESPLQGEPWPLSLEQDLAAFLRMLEKRFRSDMSDPLPAFEALGYIAAYVWKTEKPSPCTLPIPWWVVETLAIGFMKYRESAESTAPVTLGEAYQLEGRGQGKEPRIQRGLRQLRDIRIATAIASAKTDGIKLEAAFQEQANKTKLSVAQIRRIWETNHRRASSALRNLRTRITS
jgi:hypothetical protein